MLASGLAAVDDEHALARAVRLPPHLAKRIADVVKKTSPAMLQLPFRSLHNRRRWKIKKKVKHENSQARWVFIFLNYRLLVCSTVNWLILPVTYACLKD